MKFVKANLAHVYKQLATVIMGAIVIATVGVPSMVASEYVASASDYTLGSDEEPPNSFPVSENREPRYTQWVTVTAYSLEAAQTDSTPCIPANGEDLCKMREKQGYHNTIAANFLRFNTNVRLPELFGDKVFIARDRMNARYNGTNRIDVVMDTREEAIAFGVKHVKMEVF
ncbi:3D domain-containing protein [Candidatus Nomurabacteria bacterium]|nr:3D domain-containing protein [Candidatus Nomurabacteria bacterium]